MTSSSVIENVKYTNMYREKQAVNTSARSLRRLPSPAGISPRSPKSICSSLPGGPSSTRVVTLPPPTAPLGREPVQRPLGHDHTLPGQQDPDLHHRHAALDPPRDLLAAGLQLRPARTVPVRPHRPHHRHDLPDQLISELLLASPRDSPAATAAIT